MLMLNFKRTYYQLAPAYGPTMTLPGHEIIINMPFSSLLSVSNDPRGRPEGFSLKDMEVLCYIKKNSKEGHPYCYSMSV